MNALEWAEYFERKDRYTAVAEMLRRQHEAIQKLREALLFYQTAWASEVSWFRDCYEFEEKAEQALKDTEGL